MRRHYATFVSAMQADRGSCGISSSFVKAGLSDQEAIQCNRLYYDWMDQDVCLVRRAKLNLNLHDRFFLNSA